MKKVLLLLALCNFSIETYSQKDTTTRLSSYPGGPPKMYETIKSNLVYPQTAIKDGVSGKSKLKFTVDTLGNVTNIIVFKSLRGDCDTAAINALKSLSKWTPAT